MPDPKKGLSDEERQALLEALSKVDPGEIARSRESFGDVAELLEEMVNGFPAARKFLRMRGAERVRDLTSEQLKELEAFMAQEWFGKRPN